MKYVLLVYQGEAPLPGTDRWKALPAEEQKRIYADYGELNEAPGMTPGLPLGLPEAARTVQVLDGKVTVKNGPHFGLGEGHGQWVGGFSVYEAASMEAAIAVAARIPAARLGGAVEIRPAEKYW